MADEDEDFEFQLRQQQLHSETAGQQSEGEQGGATYTDPSDGTVYEWDAEKRAWFPKASLRMRARTLVSSQTRLRRSAAILE